MNISEQIKELRTIANNLSIGHNTAISNAVEKFRQAADTIESLSAKLSAANMKLSERCYGGGWISCKDSLSDEKINFITKDFCEYQVTFQSEDVKDVRHYKFGNGHWWNYGQKMDEYVTARRLPIEPYQGE